MQIRVNSDQLIKTLKKLPKKVRDEAIIPSIFDGGLFLRDEARRNVKAVATQGYSTGELEKSLTYYRMKNYNGHYRIGVSVARGAVNRKKIVNGAPVRIGLYGAVLEYGKKNQAPRSWIRKTARDNPNRVLSIVRDTIAKNLNKSVESAKK